MNKPIWQLPTSESSEAEIETDIQENRKSAVWNATANFDHEDDKNDLSIVKCSIQNGDIKDCSRSMINDLGCSIQQLQGVFAFERQFLLNKYSTFKSERASQEKVEQLMLLENGVTVRAIQIEKAMRSLNTYEDIEKIRNSMIHDPVQNRLIRLTCNS